MAFRKCGAGRVVQYEQWGDGFMIGRVNNKQSGNGVVREIKVVEGCERCNGLPLRRCDIRKENESDLSPQEGGWIIS